MDAIGNSLAFLNSHLILGIVFILVVSAYFISYEIIWLRSSKIKTKTEFLS